jgi:SAM-dependent methyltransferase
MDLINDENIFIPEVHRAKVLSLQECIDRKFFRSPDSGISLYLNLESNTLSDGIINYPIIGQSPLLYPDEVVKAWEGGALPLRYVTNPIHQYVLLSQLKQQGEINAPLDSNPYRKHQYRLWHFCKNIKGILLDVGSDKPSHSAALFSNESEYIGLDPYAQGKEFRVVGLGEVLPFGEDLFDAVIFNTSLDHILDYHTALEEAKRVLKPGGSIVIATYAWLGRASLLSDSVHFHHFREYQIIGALEQGFKIKDVKQYRDPKNSSHRYGLYVRGEKPVLRQN